jgi:hypothetical protein
MPIMPARSPRVSFAMRMRRFLPLLGLVAACTSEPQPEPDVALPFGPPPAGLLPAVAASAEPISQFVRRIHEDARGHLWLGTNGDGVARWNGAQLEWFRHADGLLGVAVRGFVEDAAGNVWIGTEQGVSKYDGQRFVHYSKRDGLPDDDVWCLKLDRSGSLWVGTLQGACRFDGTRFLPFALPEGMPDPLQGVTSARMVRSITEDRAGRIWFGTNAGAFVFDGARLTNYSTAEGLPDHNVNSVLEDRTGRVWFATSHAGVCYLEGGKVTAVTAARACRGSRSGTFSRTGRAMSGFRSRTPASIASTAANSATTRPPMASTPMRSNAPIRTPPGGSGWVAIGGCSGSTANGSSR